MRRLCALLILPLIILASCADSQKLNVTNKSGAVRLDRNGSAYVAIPSDGGFGNRKYIGSGAIVAQTINWSLSPYQVRVITGSKEEGITTAKKSAASGHFKYLFFPTIIHWEDRATGWSGKADKLKVNIAVIDVQSGKQVSFASIDGRSGLATLGGDHPQDLLSKPINEYFARLF